MSGIRYLTLAILFLSVSAVLAQPLEEWVAFYNGPANGSDGAVALAVDTGGKVYVTGGSEGSGTYYDYATMKYDQNGNQLWAARYNGPGNGADRACAVAVDDSSGCVYVTGYSEGSGTNEDYATIKYDSEGNQLWVARYDGPISGNDRAQDLALDAEANVYVTGSRAGPSYTTVKYDSDGNQLWVAGYHGGEYSRSCPYALCVDTFGNVYVTGSDEWPRRERYFCVTIKYDTDGNELWIAFYEDYYPVPVGEAVAVDASGNVYVTGHLGGFFTRDYFTIKYDSEGNELWVAPYNGPAGGDDRASALAVDTGGNVYVTGESEGSGTEDDYATIKYDPNGNQLWVARYNGPGNGTDNPRALALDASGNIYVAGLSTGSGTGWDYATNKYDSNGDPVWVARYNTPANGSDHAYALALDAYDNVYVTGVGDGDYVTIKYSQEVLVEISCEPAEPWLCRGTHFNFKLSVINNTGGNISGPLTFSGYSGYDCDPGNVLIDISRSRTYPPGVTEQYYFFKVPNAVGPGQYSTSVGGTLSGFNLFCCMNIDIVQCSPWRMGNNTEWELVEVSRPEFVPTVTELHPSYPNPFNASTEIIYTLAEAGEVKLTIYNLRGQLLESLVEGYRKAGQYDVIWDASRQASGVYFYKLTAHTGHMTGDFTEVRRMTLLK